MLKDAYYCAAAMTSTSKKSLLCCIEEKLEGNGKVGTCTLIKVIINNLYS